MSLQARDARATRQAAPSHVAPQKLFFLVLSRPILPFTLDVESYRSRLPRLYSLRVFLSYTQAWFYLPISRALIQSANMRILDARLGRNGGGVGKEDSAIHNTELNDHNVTDGSTDQDALDMAKLGLTQQTKVSTATAMTNSFKHS